MDMMKHYYLDFYEKFHCIANRCPDSCCKDWDIVVDSGAEEFYRSVQSPLGEKLRALTVTDADGDRVFVPQDGRCPFWNRDMLCDIYIELGEEHLCRTCAAFPRITQEYDGFCEHTLSFACPEAARLMLAQDNAYGALLAAEYDGDDALLRFLLTARARTAALFAGDAPFAARLADALAFNAQVQTVLQGEEPQPLAAEAGGDLGFVFALHNSLDYMSGSFRNLVRRAGESGATPSDSAEEERAFTRMAEYYIFRYYLNAVDSGDVLGAVRRIFCAWVVISAAVRTDGAPDLTAVMQRYSKEVEHSYENGEELDFAFAADREFSVPRLLGILEKLS